jgi:hypothetical protein
MAPLAGNSGQVGKRVGDQITASLGEYAETLTTQLQPRYYQNAYRGNVYFNSITSANGTGYTGAGTPLLAVWNPTYTKKNLIVFNVMAAITSYASNGTIVASLWGGPTASITGTLVPPVSALTLVSSMANGSVARCSQNAATTGASTLSYIGTVTSSYGPGTSVGACMSHAPVYDCAGPFVVPPGAMIALGQTLTGSWWWDAYLSWIEVPV